MAVGIANKAWKAVLPLLAFGLLGTGCTELESEPVLDQTNATRGYGYALPMAQYKITLTRRITACDGLHNAVPDDADDVASGGTDTAVSEETDNEEKKQSVPVLYPEVNVTFKAEIEETVVADPAHTYTIDYESLSSWSKTSSLTVETHPDGRLKSINAAADDQTGEIAKNVIATVGQIAMAAVGVPAPGTAIALANIVQTDEDKNAKNEQIDALVESARRCEPSVLKALEELSSTKRELLDHEKALESATEELETYRTDYESHPDPTPEMGEELNRKIKAVRRARNDLNATVNKRAPSLAKVTDVMDPVLWPKLGDQTGPEITDVFDDGEDLSKRWLTALDADAQATLRTELSKLDSDQIGALYRQLVPEQADNDTDSDTSGNETPDTSSDPADGPAVNTINPFAVDVYLTRRTGDPANGRRTAVDASSETADDPTMAAQPDKGIYYRIPMPVTLRLACRAPCGDEPTFFEHDGLAPQSGPLMVLPLKNSAMQSNSLVVTFGEMGVPSKLTYADKSARGAEATAVLRQAATTAREVREQAMLADLRRLQLETAESKQRNALFTSQQSLRQARELADLQQEKADLQARVATLQAQLALVKAQAELKEQIEQADFLDEDAHALLERARNLLDITPEPATEAAN